MPLRCTCGALLPEDARFCHKCGKPQYEEDIARLNELEAQTIPIPPPPPAPVMRPGASGTFSIGRAIRISLAIAGLATIVSRIMPQEPLFVSIILVAAGFASVKIYLGRSFSKLDVPRAALLGALPWLWISLLGIGATALLLSPEGKEILRQGNQPELIKMLDSLKNPADVILGIVQSILFGALGGILAARWRPRNGPSH